MTINILKVGIHKFDLVIAGGLKISVIGVYQDSFGGVTVFLHGM